MTILTLRQLIAIATLLAGLAGIGGCSTMLDTRLLDVKEDGLPSCRSSSLGAYHLPKRLVLATVTLNPTPKRYDLKIDNALLTVADTKHMFCLDYSASSFAEDHIRINRTNDGILLRVYTRAIDKTEDIAKKLLEGIGTAAAASGFGRSALEAGTTTMAKFRFDPFDEGEMTGVNVGLKPFGYCIFLYGGDDSYVPAWSAEKCGAKAIPNSYSDAPLSTAGLKGIYYRPNLSHRLVVLRRADPTSDDPWKLEMIKNIEMPNGGPLFSVNVDRSLFVTRLTDITFDKGVLQDVTIKKDSEANAIINIPIKAVQVAVSIPARAIAIELNRTRNQQAVIVANARLIQTLREYNAALNPAPAVSQGSGPTSDNRTASSRTFEPEEDDARRAGVAACLRSGYTGNSPDAETICRAIVESGV